MDFIKFVLAVYCIFNLAFSLGFAGTNPNRACPRVEHPKTRGDMVFNFFLPGAKYGCAASRWLDEPIEENDSASATHGDKSVAQSAS